MPMLSNPLGASACAWCARRESNPHVFRHWNLNPARLPVPPRARGRPEGARPIARIGRGASRCATRNSRSPRALGGKGASRCNRNLRPAHPRQRQKRRHQCRNCRLRRNSRPRHLPRHNLRSLASRRPRRRERRSRRRISTCLRPPHRVHSRRQPRFPR